MSRTDTVQSIVEPLAAAVGASVYDVTMSGGRLVVAVSRSGGIDLDTLGDISRALGARLDELDLFAGSYTLEVTSPGLERHLRLPAHFVGALGEEISVRLRTAIDGERRIRGVLVAADDDGVTVEADTDTHRLAYTDVDRARTVFSWGPAGKSPSTEQKARQT